MSLVARRPNVHRESLDFDLQQVAEELRKTCPEVIFAALMGSARDGHVAAGSDVDLALYLDQRPDLDLCGRVEAVVSRFAPGVHCDLGFLREADPVYRFEALKGRLLFTRDQGRYLSFFSLTCREYEDQLLDYERQHRYRMEAA